jgi:hypothetical protein
MRIAWSLDSVTSGAVLEGLAGGERTKMEGLGMVRHRDLRVITLGEELPSPMPWGVMIISPD